MHINRTIDTYERFERNIRAWVDREIGSLVVVGPAGIGKTSSYERALGNLHYTRFGGRVSAIEAYCDLYDHKHLPVVFDDVANLLRDRMAYDILKQLCGQTLHKMVSWKTSTHLLGGRPQQFMTSSNTLIVLNELPGRNADLLAILDRLDVIRFDPTKPEIISKMRQIWPQESIIIDVMAVLPASVTLRTMQKVIRWRDSEHLDWVEELLSECGVSTSIQQLVQIMTESPKNQWCKCYMNSTGRSERSFRRDQKLAAQLVQCAQTDRRNRAPRPNVA